MNEKYKASWRSSRADRQHYSRRKVLYEAILSFSQLKGITPEEAADIIDSIRVVKNFSVPKLQAYLKKGGKLE